jgi:hypothetical protein
MIGSDHQYYVDGVHYFDCLYRIADINNDGFADIAIGCRETNEKTKETFWVYSIQKGVPNKIEVREKGFVRKIKEALCEGNKSSPLCEK